MKEVDSGGENAKGSKSQHSEISRFRAFQNAGFAFSEAENGSEHNHSHGGFEGPFSKLCNLE